jgi:hypothetical protein
MAAAFLALAAATLLPVSSGWAARSSDRAEGREIFRIRIVNDHQGEVSVSRDSGDSWHALGSVSQYTEEVSRMGFTASKWVPAGRVAATAVNAIHINVGYNPRDDRGVVFSILPREFRAPPASYASFLSPNSSIYTDLRAGYGIFGGGEAPLVGSHVFVEGRAGALLPLDDSYVPRRGDALVIVAVLPSRYPVAAVFENRPGGAITLLYPDGGEEFLGWVIRPIRGIGRFAGSLYAAVGRIRANHAGVVDVSTSPVGSLGGFQMIPMGHALSPEMRRAWDLTQWMVLGPAGEDSLLWDGLMPLFYQHLRPDYRADDLWAPDWQERLLARFVVDVEVGDGWAPMPSHRLAADPSVPLPSWAGQALAPVERLRILFPLAERPALRWDR